MVRTVEPVLAEVSREAEEAALTLGASRMQTFVRVILPTLFPALATGFTLAFARGAGEYGSLIFIAGNMPFKSEISPLLIITQLEEYDYRGPQEGCRGVAGGSEGAGRPAADESIRKAVAVISSPAAFRSRFLLGRVERLALNGLIDRFHELRVRATRHAVIRHPPL